MWARSHPTDNTAQGCTVGSRLTALPVSSPPHRTGGDRHPTANALGREYSSGRHRPGAHCSRALRLARMDAQGARERLCATWANSRRSATSISNDTFGGSGEVPSVLPGAPVETDSSQEGSSPCEPAGGPRPRVQRERCRRQHVAAPITKLDLPRGVESGHIATRWTHSERKRFPPVVKARMRDSDRERGVIDRGQPSFSEKL